MLKFENTSVMNLENALRGMRNPMNSWDKGDSLNCGEINCEYCKFDIDDEQCNKITWEDIIKIGPNDLKLCQNLIKAGTEHSKFMRQIFVSVDITAPLYWWKEFDTYKIGTTANSCSTMHKIHTKEFTLKDFSCEHLDIRAKKILRETISALNDYRDLFVNYNEDDFEIKGCPSKKDIWWQMIQLLPSSYNQKRTVTLNYEVIKSMYHQRKNHKLDEWRINFIDWIKELPFAEELIMLEK